MQIAVTEEGRPAERPPAVEAIGGAVRFASGGAVSGVWPIQVTPDSGATQVELLITALGETWRRSLPVSWPELGALHVPERVDGLVQEPVTFLVSGSDLPPPERLSVVVAEGTVRERRRVEGGVEVVVEPGPSPYPRVIPFGVSDVSSPDRPVWGVIRLRARPRIPLEVGPGVTLTLEVGGRAYGPLRADTSGRLVARIDQYPGEASADATLTDDLGNRTTFVVPLASTSEPTLVALPGARGGVRGRPREIWLRAHAANGAPWRADPPTCRSAAVGALELVQVAVGSWAVPLEGRVPDALVDVRVECRLGDEASTTVRVGAPSGVPERLLLQVWPTELSTDLPVAELRVALEDARGQRLPVDAVRVRAERGEVRMTPDNGVAATGEYRGEAAIEHGRDALVARWEPEASQGPVADIALGWDGPPREGVVRVFARATDGLGLPVEGAVVALGVSDAVFDAATDATGWARAEIAVPPGAAPLVVTAAHARRVSRGIALRGVPGPTRDGAALLEAREELSVSPGRLSGISVDVDPPILRTGRGAVAWVTVLLEDRVGRPLVDQPVALEASEGTVGPLVARPDGSWIAEYVPAPGDRPREVTLTARTDGLRTTARLELEPRPGRFAIGPNVGWVTNFGAVSSPQVGVDLDVRTAWLDEGLVIRGSVSGHALSGAVETGFGEPVSLIGGVFPGSLAVLIREDRGRLSAWGGAGGIVGVHTVRARLGDALLTRGARPVSGAAVLGGAGARWGAGDLVAEARWAWIPGPSGEIGFTGNLAGLSLGVGYRLVY